MAKPRLHLGADASDTRIEKALLQRGHDVTRTPNEWAALDADDEEQLLGATARGRTILTFNVRHFMPLAQKNPRHAGILLAGQKGVSILIKALDRFFNEAAAEEMQDQVRWLNDWEE